MRYLFIALNLITFITFAWDKHKAKNNQRRISESTLLLLTLFGGTIGAILAMILFRHKTAKTSFLLKVAAIILFQILLILYFFNTYFPNY